MMEVLLGAAGCFAAVIGYSILVETPGKYILQAGAAGAGGAGVYICCLQLGLGTVFATFLSALVIALLAHTFARIFKAPVTVFLIAGILPTVPGAGMYRIVYYMILNDRSQTAYYLLQTLEIAGVIALAVFIVDALFRLHVNIRKKGA